MRRQLTCSSFCGGERFEAVDPIVEVDEAGAVIHVEIGKATFVCATCRSVAIDMVAVGRAMDVHDDPELLVCPVCEVEMLPPEDESAQIIECPACGSEYSIEEARPRLLGGRSSPLIDGEDDATS